MGLYDDDNSAITGGDVADVLYWQTKFAAQKLDAALQTRQPEYAIGSLIPSVVNGAEDVLKTYPNHADLQAWRDKALSIRAKINPDASPADFNGKFSHWKDYSYEAGWRSYHLSKMHAANEDWTDCLSHARETVTQFGRSLDRMELWPEDVQAFIRQAHADAEKLAVEAQRRR